MQFCSVGAKKLNTESEAMDAYQYFFSSSSNVPTTQEEFLDILPDVRSIGYAYENGNVSCTPVAGYKDGKLYLTGLNINKFDSESGTVSTCMPDTTRDRKDLFKIFGCVGNYWETTPSIRSGSRSIFFGNVPTYSVTHSQSPLKYKTNTTTDGMFLSFVPNDLNTNGADILMPYTMAGTVQTYRYYSTAPGYGFNVNYTYETYMCDMEFKLDAGTLKSKQISSPTSFSGTTELTIAKSLRAGSLMVSRATQSDMASGNVSYGRRYSVGDYNYTTATCTQNSPLPYIRATKEDETIQLSFSVISQITQNGIKMVIRKVGEDFVSDQTQAGQVPQMLLQNSAASTLDVVFSF
jgi:hypothetical protein